MVHDSAAVAACGEALCARGGGCDLKLSRGPPGAWCLLPKSEPQMSAGGFGGLNQVCRAILGDRNGK